MDSFSTFDFTSQLPSTTRSEEVEVPTEYETSGRTSSANCIIA